MFFLPACDNTTIILSDVGTYYWATPNYPSDYEDGYTCTLTLIVRILFFLGGLRA